MAMKITVMDKRHKGKPQFSFYVTPTLTITSSVHTTELFLMWREWCFEAFGVGIERDLSQYREDIKWAWHTEAGEKRLYFKSSKELNWFKMRWL